MKKLYFSIGLMSGTSGDGIDCSIIHSDGNDRYSVVLDKFFDYDFDFKSKLSNLVDKISSQSDLKNFKEEILEVEKEITLLHTKAVMETLNQSNLNIEDIDLIGFHGHTILHSSKDKVTKQIGDGKLLSQLCKKKVIYDFRKNDLKNGGEGAPLTPIFHKIFVHQKKIKTPVVILNIGGISNWTLVTNNNFEEIFSSDLGPGNCLIDQWVKANSKESYDKDGNLAGQGKINKLILNQAIDNWENNTNINDIKKNHSYDLKDFEISFLKGLSLEEGSATVTEFTSHLITEKLNKFKDIKKVIICGGGRKNKYLIKKIVEKCIHKVESIDVYGTNGDFIESQAFAFLAIRSFLNLPITSPNTTGCSKASTGGVLIKN